MTELKKILLTEDRAKALRQKFNRACERASELAFDVVDPCKVSTEFQITDPIEGVPDGNWKFDCWTNDGKQFEFAAPPEIGADVYRTHRIPCPYHVGDEVVLCEDAFRHPDGSICYWADHAENVMDRAKYDTIPASEMDPKDARWIATVKDIEVEGWQEWIHIDTLEVRRRE
jgi:hypothetical protein